MLFDARSFVSAPGCGGGGNAIGEEAVDDAGQKISQVLSIAGDGNDLVLVSVICNEGIHAVVGIHEPGNHPEAKLLSRERLEHLLDCVERVSAAGAPGVGSKHRSLSDTVLR